MRLRNILIVVRDIELAKCFYRDIFGLTVVSDLGGNVIMTEGLVLQEQKLWENALEKQVVKGACDFELYFEETNLDLFIQKLQNSKFNIKYVDVNEKANNGKRMIRIWDPDQHIIEVGEAFR